MSDLEPNTKQQRLIDETEGIYHVDAGAGTGKTFAVTRRYAEIVDQDNVEPGDVLLVTFTNSAATEMRERIVDHCHYGMRDLADAPIQTFHSYCHDLLDQHGYAAPTHLGIDDRITDAVEIVEDDLVEHELFREFYGQFRDAHPEYGDLFRVLSNPLEGLDLINELASKGVFPTDDGWYRDGEDALDGSFETFKEHFDACNLPRNDGRKQSALRDDLSRFGKNKTYLPNTPSKAYIRGGRGTKQLDDDIAREVFDADREQLKAFVHDLYFEYLEFALSRDYLNFGFLQLFAFVTLCEDPDVRQRVAFDYVMVDEFQDTSEIQFKLALLLSGTDNLCVVGDWKQSIYSFQYADVANITDFDERLQRFADELNDGGNTERVAFATEDIAHIQLVENYRSTQTVLDFSRNALTTPATSSESVSEDVLDGDEPLQSNADVDQTRIEGISHEDEHEAVLAKIQEIVGNDAYLVENDAGDLVTPSYDDIAVLTRTRSYGRELLDVADDYDFPMAYDGEVELFDSDPAKLLLAWLRIVDSEADRGWAVVLERAGYTLDEVDAILDREAYPSNMATFRDELASLSTVGAVARRVFERYDLHGAYADELLHLIQSVHDATTMTPGDLIRFIERAIENGSTHAVNTSAGMDSVTVQTIHGAKGLEYPIVILANLNDGSFPPSTHSSGVLRYEESIGVRQRKYYSEVGSYPHVYDNWRYDVLRHCLPDSSDEERRLLYVAITRAESHLVLAGGEDPSPFLEGLPVDVQEASIDLSPVSASTQTQTQLPFSVLPAEGPAGYTPHDLMDSSVFDEMESDPAMGESDAGEGRGMDFGSQVHDFAERYALGEAVEPSNEHEERIVELLDGLDGEILVEEDAVLPLSVDGEQVAISGIVDLVHVDGATVEIIDYKTDLTRVGESEYRKQLSVYYHVLDTVYPERTVTASILYTRTGERVDMDELPKDELAVLVSEQY